MRAAVLGCAHQGKKSLIYVDEIQSNDLGACFPGYFRVNSEAQCGKEFCFVKFQRIFSFLFSGKYGL